jgi:predicted GNAT superfamily acetyltransferase
MLGVCPEYRAQKLGFRLKCEQRKYVRDQGIDAMTWTFDPLRSLNAYFNFRKLGVVADRYFQDFYGNEPSSFLHKNGTDRFWVSWHLSHPRVVERIEGRSIDIDLSSLPVLVAVCETGVPIVRDMKAAFRSPKFVIEIPGNIGAVEADNPEMARSWRAATFDAFSKALEAGYVVEDFSRAERAGQSCGAYVLSKDTGLSIW